MIMNIKVSDTVSLTVPVRKTSDNNRKRLLLSFDTDSAGMVKAGQAYALMTEGKDRFKTVETGAIRSVETNAERIIVTI